MNTKFAEKLAMELQKRNDVHVKSSDNWMEKTVKENFMYFLQEAKKSEISKTELINTIEEALKAENTDFLRSGV